MTKLGLVGPATFAPRLIRRFVALAGAARPIGLVRRHLSLLRGSLRREIRLTELGWSAASAFGYRIARFRMTFNTNVRLRWGDARSAFESEVVKRLAGDLRSAAGAIVGLVPQSGGHYFRSVSKPPSKTFVGTAFMLLKRVSRACLIDCLVNE